MSVNNQELNINDESKVEMNIKNDTVSKENSILNKKSKKKSSKKKETKENDLPIEINNDGNNQKEITNETQFKDFLTQNNLRNSKLTSNPKDLSPPPNESQDKCEGCFVGKGVCFCNDCGKIYCAICDKQLHLIPAYTKHERTSLAVLASINLHCCHHKLSLRFYCESCDEPICQRCLEQGPHNNKLHNVSPIFFIYRKYFSNIKDNYLKSLIEKNSKIESIMLFIENLIKQTKNDSSVILRGINSEYDSIIDNLNSLEGKKFAMLNYKSAEAQKDLVAINEILDQIDENGYNFDAISNGSNGPSGLIGKNTNSNNKGSDFDKKNEGINKIITFLLQYKGLSEKIDSIVAKPSPNVDFNQKEMSEMIKFPADVSESQKKIDNYEKIKILLKVKEDIIWQLMQSENDEIPEIEEIRQNAKREMEEWSKLADKYLKELQKYNLVCSFCGEFISSDNVNVDCKNNKIKKNNNGPNNQSQNVSLMVSNNQVNNNLNNLNFTAEIPPDNYFGNNKHYFSGPSDDYARKIKENPNITKGIPEEVFNKVGVEMPNPFEQNPLNVSTTIKNNKQFYENPFTGDWVCKVAKVIEKDHINLYQVLSDFDLDSDDIITLDDLNSALKRIGVIFTEKDKSSLSKYFFTSGIKNNRIDIKAFARNFSSRLNEENEKENFEQGRVYKSEVNRIYTSNQTLSMKNNYNTMNNFYNNNFDGGKSIGMNTSNNFKNTLSGNIFNFNQGY